MVYEWLGVMGASLLIIAWIFPTLKTLKNKRSDMNLWFEIISFIASGILTIYSALINNYIFVVINGIAFTLIFMNIQFIPNKFKKIEHDMKEIIGFSGKKYYHMRDKKK